MTVEGYFISMEVIFVKKVILFVLVAFSFATAALANSGPVYWKWYPSSDILTVDKDSPIEVTNENLIFDFSDDEEFRSHHSYECKVTAEYEMVNPTNENLSIKMAFPFIESIRYLSEESIKITADREELPYEIYLGEIMRNSNRQDGTEEENYFEFEKIIGSITDDIYKADNFTEDEIGKLYSIDVEPSSDEGIEIVINLNFDNEKTKVLAAGFNGFFREEGNTRITAWCRESEVLEIYVLGEDADFSIFAYTDGTLKEKTDLFTYEISEKEIDVKTYLLDYIRSHPYIDYNNVSDIQLYNLFAKVMDEQFSNNLGFSAADEVSTYGSSDRMIILVYDIEFPKNSSKTVSVSYKTLGTMDRRDTKEPLYTYDYILNPAENWKDFKNLNIKIIPPAESPYVVESSIELNKEGNIYTASLRNLPEDDFEFTIYYKEKVTLMDRLAGEIGRSIGYTFMFMPFIFGVILVIVIVYVSKKSVL